MSATCSGKDISKRAKQLEESHCAASSAHPAQRSTDLMSYVVAKGWQHTSFVLFVMKLSSHEELFIFLIHFHTSSVFFFFFNYKLQLKRV